MSDIINRSKSLLGLTICWSAACASAQNLNAGRYLSNQTTVREPSAMNAPKRQVDTVPSPLAINLGLTENDSVLGPGSGGGGNLLSELPVTPEYIEEALWAQKSMVRAWFNRIEYFTKSDDYWQSYYGHYGIPKLPDTILKKLFFGPRDIFSLIAKLKIEAPRNRPCHDAAGNPVDGSIHADIPDAICISVKRLTEKLNRANYRAETTALIVHEVMHLMGGDEQEAVLVQKYSDLAYMDGNPVLSAPFIFTEDTRISMMQKTIERMKVTKSAEDLDFLAGNLNIQLYSYAGSNFATLDPAYGTDALRADTDDTADQMSFRTGMILTAFTGCKLHSNNGPCLYFKAFGDKEQMAVDDFMSFELHAPCCSKRIHPLMVHKIKDHATLLQELNEIEDFIVNKLSPELHEFGTGRFNVVTD